MDVNQQSSGSKKMAVFSILGLIIVLFVVWVAMQPAEFKISRSLTISARPEVLFSQVNNLHHFNEWNPWAKIDPNSVATFEGADEGVGAIMRWNGNQDVGQGSMSLVESRPHEYIQFKMEFLKPFQATNIAEFSFKEEGEQTIVTWSMSGKNNFVGKAMNMIMNCDKMVGGQFEKGLSNLKAIVEK
jgi:hypothetical protein